MGENNKSEKTYEGIGCDKFDAEHPELIRSCGDILFSNKIWLCKICFEKYKNNQKWKRVITR
jgi:hypothetical protein